MRSVVSFKGGEIAQAKDYLDQALKMAPQNEFVHLLHGFLYQYEGQNDQASMHFDEAARQAAITNIPDPGWSRLLILCVRGRVPDPSFSTWAMNLLPESGCLPADPNARVVAAYDLLQESLLQRRELPLIDLLGAQCPFLYTQDQDTGQWEFETTILYNIVGLEASQRRPLKQFNGTLLIREEESEVSYLNRLYVLAQMEDGSFHRFSPQIDELQQADDDYIVLHRERRSWSH